MESQLDKPALSKLRPAADVQARHPTCLLLLALQPRMLADPNAATIAVVGKGCDVTMGRGESWKHGAQALRAGLGPNRNSTTASRTSPNSSRMVRPPTNVIRELIGHHLRFGLRRRAIGFADSIFVSPRL